MERKGTHVTLMGLGLAVMPVLAAARMGTWETLEGGNGEMVITKSQGVGEGDSYRAEYSHLVPGDEPGTYKWETLSTQDPKTVSSLVDSISGLLETPFSFLNDFPSDMSQPAWVDMLDFDYGEMDMDTSVSNDADLRKVMRQRVKPAMKDCMKSKQMPNWRMGDRGASTWDWTKGGNADTADTLAPKAEPVKASPHSSSGLVCILFALGFLTLAAVGMVSVINCLLSYCCGSCRGASRDEGMSEPLLDRQFLVEGVTEAPHVHKSMPSTNKPTLVNVVTYEPLKPSN
uniref:Uncharacterized protein n=1 Tax=Picocystis salinarum TaxID=88271 RepID=A0A7S3XFD0_9CHLO